MSKLPRSATAAGILGAMTGTMSWAYESSNPHSADVYLSSFIEDIGAAERVVAADTLRTLTQEFTAYACLLASGIAPDANRAALKTARLAFLQNYEALRLGDISMNIIGKETNRKALADLDEIQKLWKAVDTAILNLLEDGTNDDAINVINQSFAPLKDVTFHLASAISGIYSNPAELRQVDAILLDIVSRQATTTYKITRDACAVWTRETVEAKEGLQSGMSLLTTSLAALYHGYPQLGLLPPPTQGISDALEELIADWDSASIILDELLADSNVSKGEMEELSKLMNVKAQKLRALAGLYLTYSKHEY